MTKIVNKVEDILRVPISSNDIEVCPRVLIGSKANRT